MDKLLDSLITTDTNEFKNGILYDRVFNIARLNDFNKNDSLNTSNYRHFKRAISELHSASLNPNFYSAQEVKNIAYHFERNNIIQMGVLNMDFTYIDSLALDSINPKLQIVNQKLARLPNKDPYIDSHVFVASPLNEKTIRGTSINFEFGKVFINKSDKQINKLEVSFENNQNYIIINDGVFVNTSINVNFQDSGTKNILVEVTFLDGTLMKTNSSFNLNTSTPDYSGIQTITATKPYQGFGESSTDGTFYGQGEYKVFLGDGHNDIIKPYILTDGFDAGDTRNIDGIVEMMKYKDNNTASFLDDLDVIILNFPKYVIDTLFYDGWENDSYGNGPPDFVYEIYQYRDGGGDFIQRNAKVFEALIDHVNTILNNNGSTAKIKVAGPSGGALVTRYGLVEMEQAGENHNVDLYLSFDGPHKGANISIGIQKAIKYFEIEDALYGLDVKAAQQMLIDHYRSYTNGHPEGAPNYRNAFQNELDNMGFPQQCRNVDVLNGCINGTIKATVENNMIYASTQIMNNLNDQTIWINYTSNNGSKLVFRYLKEYFYGLYTAIDYKSYRNTSIVYGSLDNAPGGYFQTTDRVNNVLGGSFPYYYCNILQNNIPNLNDLLGDYSLPIQFVASILIDWGNVDLTDDFSFVPSKSALSFSGSNKLWHENIGCRDLVCTGETPFNCYYAPITFNQEHASVYTETGQWVLDEVNGNLHQYPQIDGDCLISSSSILGDNTICYNQSKTYQLSNSCIPGNVTWTVSTSGKSNLQIISSSNTEITVKATHPLITQAWIKANFEGGQSITKNLVGKPHISCDITANNIFVDIELVSDVLDPTLQGITSISWTQTGGTGNLSGNNNSFSAYASGSGTWDVNGTVEACNTCGCSDVDFYLVPEVGSDNDPKIEIISVSQNQYQVIDPCCPN